MWEGVKEEISREHKGVGSQRVRKRLESKKPNVNRATHTE